MAESQCQAGRGEVLTAKQSPPRVRQATRKRVSLDHVYGLLHRYGWRKLSLRPRHVKGDPAAQEGFKGSPADRRLGIEDSPFRDACPVALPG